MKIAPKKYLDINKSAQTQVGKYKRLSRFVQKDIPKAWKKTKKYYKKHDELLKVPLHAANAGLGAAVAAGTTAATGNPLLGHAAGAGTAAVGEKGIDYLFNAKKRARAAKKMKKIQKTQMEAAQAQKQFFQKRTGGIPPHS